MSGNILENDGVAQNYTAEIEHLFQQLKADRDLWQARALQYKEAFEAQSTQLHEVLNICFATQAELENKRLTDQRGKTGVHQRVEVNPTSEDDIAYHEPSASKISADSHLDIDWQSSFSTDNEFGHVKILLDKNDLPDALEEVDRILPGPLSHEARMEAILLKSAILRVSGGPALLYDALAQCSEALELCGRISDLEEYLPKIQYQRGLCLYQLGLVSQAHDAFNAVGPSNAFHEKAIEYRQSCDLEADISPVSKRRSAFDEHRTFDDRYLALFNQQDRDKSRRRRISAQFKIRSSSSSARNSLASRWMMFKSV